MSHEVQTASQPGTPHPQPDRQCRNSKKKNITQLCNPTAGSRIPRLQCYRARFQGFQQGSRTVPVFRGVHFRVTTPWPQRLKPNRFAVGNKCDPHRGIYPDIYSDILSNIPSGIVSGILSGIPSESDILSAILFGIWSGIRFRSGTRELANSP